MRANTGRYNPTSPPGQTPCSFYVAIRDAPRRSPATRIHPTSQPSRICARNEWPVGIGFSHPIKRYRSRCLFPRKEVWPPPTPSTALRAYPLRAIIFSGRAPPLRAIRYDVAAVSVPIAIARRQVVAITKPADLAAEPPRRENDERPSTSPICYVVADCSRRVPVSQFCPNAPHGSPGTTIWHPPSRASVVEDFAPPSRLVTNSVVNVSIW